MAFSYGELFFPLLLVVFRLPLCLGFEKILMVFWDACDLKVLSITCKSVVNPIGGVTPIFVVILTFDGTCRALGKSTNYHLE